MGKELNVMAEDMKKLPLLSEALKNRKQMQNRGGMDNTMPPLHDGLFVRDVLMTEESIQVDGEYTVVNPVHSLSVRVDLFEETDTGRSLIKQGTTSVSFGGVCNVIGNVSITYEEGYGKKLVAVLTGDRYTEETDGMVNAQETTSETELGVYEIDHPMLDTIEIVDPVSKQNPPRDYIYICYNRRVQAKEAEDYFVPEGGGDNFYIPLKGKAYFKDVNDWFDTVIPPDTTKEADSGSNKERTSELRIFMQGENGGEVTYQNTPENFIHAFQAISETSGGKVTQRGFSWDFGTIPWVTSSPFAQSKSYDMDFEFKLVYKLRSDSEDENHVMTINSYQSLPADYKKVGFMRIYWGCLYLGTKITMEDGSRKRVEEIQAGDCVKSREGCLRVKDIVEGREPLGVLLIETESKKVYVSDQHPMITNQGIVLACNLIDYPDIYIVTEDGDEEHVEDVNRYVFQDDRVYSLILESPDGRELPIEEHVFYANGLLTGDNDLQKYAADKKWRQERERFAIGENWRQDVEAARQYCQLYQERDILWKEDVQWEESDHTSEIPPYITQVLCREVTEEGENKGKMEYIVSFDTKDRQTSSGEFKLGLKSDCLTEPVEVSVSAGQMQGTIYYDLDAVNDYFLYVYPAGNKAACSKEIVALPKTGFQVERVGFIDSRKMMFDYQCEKLIPENVLVSLKGTDSSGAGITRHVTLTPFERTFDLYDYGVENFSQLTLSAYAEYQDCGAEIAFYLPKTYTVILKEPETGWIHTEIVSGASGGEDKLKLEVSMNQTVYTEAKLMAELFREGESLYVTDAVSASQSGGTYLLEIPMKQVQADGFTEYEVRFRCRKDKLFTNAGRAYRLIMQMPEIEQMEFQRVKEGTAWNVSLQMSGDYNCLHDYAVKESGTTVSAVKGPNQTEIVSLKETTQTTASLAYSSGVVRGPFPNAVDLKKEQFYVVEKDGVTVICLSDTPKIDMTADIKVRLEDISCSETIGQELLFQLVAEDGVTYLKMLADVWSFSDGENGNSGKRETVKENYESFLKQLEEKNYTASQIRTIRKTIGDYLPMTPEEQAFYKLHFRTDFEEAKSVLELVPGVTVRVSHSMFECVGDENDSEYLNDYVASAEEQFCVVERDGRLCLDPYVRKLGNGSYVDLMLQPTTAEQGHPVDERYYTTGGAAVIDLQSSTMERPYLVIAYHSKFPSVGTLVNPMMARNVALLAAPTYRDLDTGVRYFFENNTTDCADADIKGSYLKGRVHMTPCMEVFVNGHSYTVPFFTTVADMVQRFGMDTVQLSLQREGRTVDAGYDDIKDLLLYMGDCLYIGEKWGTDE